MAWLSDAMSQFTPATASKIPVKSVIYNPETKATSIKTTASADGQVTNSNPLWTKVTDFAKTYWPVVLPAGALLFAKMSKDN